MIKRILKGYHRYWWAKRYKKMGCKITSIPSRIPGKRSLIVRKPDQCSTLKQKAPNS